MPDSTTPQGPFFDGMGMKAVINNMKDYHDANMGSGGSSQIPYPGLQVEYNNDNDYCTVYCTTGYEGIESEVTLGYTTDGTTPSVSSPEFVSPQRIEKNCTLMVRAFVAVSTTNIIESPSNSVITPIRTSGTVVPDDSSPDESSPATTHWVIDSTRPATKRSVCSNWGFNSSVAGSRGWNQVMFPCSAA